MIGAAPRPEPGTRTCDWCDKPHRVSVPLKTKAVASRGSSFVYACYDHKHLAHPAAGVEVPD